MASQLKRYLCFWISVSILERLHQIGWNNQSLLIKTYWEFKICIDGRAICKHIQFNIIIHLIKCHKACQLEGHCTRSIVCITAAHTVVTITQWSHVISHYPVCTVDALYIKSWFTVRTETRLHVVSGLWQAIISTFQPHFFVTRWRDHLNTRIAYHIVLQQATRCVRHNTK